MALNTANDSSEKHTTRNIFVLISVFIIAVSTILTLFPYLHTSAFAMTILPAVVGGWLYGRNRGLIVSLIAITLSVGCQILLGMTARENMFQAIYGGTVVLIIGIIIGHFRDNGPQSRIATASRHQAEENQRNLEKQLQQAQKMEAIGTLAGGVAHDMNNILGIIMSSASVLKQHVRDDPRNKEDVDNILNACRRGRDLTRNLLGFARKGTYVKEILDINTIAEEATRLLTPALSKNISLETEFDRNLYQIYGDRSQIEQAILNICINASEAITSSKGMIRITTRNGGDNDRRIIEAHGLYSGDFAMIEISDTGHGIDKETIRHVFEPFYTTKSPGKGTGLGLSMAYGTMKNHGGGIDIKSRPGKGTTITMMLPALVSEQRVKVQARISSPPPALSTGSILLVDDEPLIRTSNKRMLTQLGYEVMLAESGERALQIYEEYSQRIFLIILDFVMPGINGAETFERLKAIDPEVKVLISSGYSKDGNIEAVLENGALGFIQKPFDLEQLGELLRQMPKSEENRRQRDLPNVIPS